MRSAAGYGCQGRTPVALREREHECDTLARALAAAAEGIGSAVAVEGEAGIGKTALLTHAARLASDSDMRVLDGRGWDLERHVPYGVVRQLFAAVLASAAREQRARWMSGAARLAGPAVSAAPGRRTHAESGAVVRGLYWLAANLASEQPLLLLVDDVQWTDAASLAFLAALARSVEELPILILCAAQTGAGAGADEGRPAVAEPGLARTILRPAPLSVDAAKQIVDERLSARCSAPFARACHSATRGNPLLLAQLARGLEGEAAVLDAARGDVEPVTTTSVGRAACARLERLDESANRLAAAVAVLGKRTALDRAAALAGLAGDVAASAADALTAAAILDDGTALEFIHPVVRAAVYAQLAFDVRNDAHKRAARLAAQDGVDEIALAAHLLVSAPAGDPWVVEQLSLAAQDARARGARDAAYTYLERARREPPPPQARARVALSLGAAELQLGRPEAIAHLSEALRYAPDTATRFAAAQELTWALWSGGRMDDALQLGQQVLASMPPDDEEAMRFEGRLAALGQFSPPTARPLLERLERYEHRLVGETAGERLILACLAFRAARRGATAATTADFARRALADGRLLHDDDLGGPNFLMAVGALVFSDRLEEAEHHLDLALEAARAQGSEAAFEAASGLRCQTLLRRGRLRQAEEEALGVLAAVRTHPGARPMLLAAVLGAMLERSDPGSWEAFLAQHRIDGDLSGTPDTDALLLTRARLRLGGGDATAALRDLDQLCRRDERSGCENPWTQSSACRALSHLQLGQHDEARAFAAEELTRAGRWGTPSALAGALRTTALVQGGGDAIELLRAAVTAVEDSPARYELATSLAELGAALRRAGLTLEARRPLRRALEIARDCGAVRLARATRHELLVAGARPGRSTMRARDTLAPEERQIAQLAAEGHANRDIAQALFVTVRTVETHLSQVYAKLDVRSPDRLTAALQT